MLDAKGVTANRHTLCTWVGLAEVDSADLETVRVIGLLIARLAHLLFVIFHILTDLKVRRLLTVFTSSLLVAIHKVVVYENHDGV